MTALQQVEPVGHSSAILAIILAWSGVLTPILTLFATLASLIWFLVCIWESQTMRHWKNNMIMRHRARKLVRLKAREMRVQAAITAMEVLRTAKADATALLNTAAADAARVVAKEPVNTASKLPPVRP